ncbi:hypothetical protein [Nostoc sp. DSM 114159]|jgi:hypothetical protein
MYIKEEVTNPKLLKALNKALLPYRNPKVYYPLKNLDYWKNRMKRIVKSIAFQSLPASVLAIAVKLCGDEYQVLMTVRAVKAEVVS